MAGHRAWTLILRNLGAWETGRPAFSGSSAVPPEMKEVASSNLHSVGRDGLDLYVRFRGKGGTPGPLYRVDGAAEEHHDALAAADSPGKYYLSKIRGRLPAVMVAG